MDSLSDTIWRVYLQKDNSVLFFSKCFFYYIIMFLLCYLAVFFVIVSPNQNNPNVVWLTLIGMHNEKTWFLKMVKNWVISFCKWTLHICTHIHSNAAPYTRRAPTPKTTNITNHQLLTIKKWVSVVCFRTYSIRFIVFNKPPI